MGSSKFVIYALDVGAGQIALSPVPGRSGLYGTDLSRVLKWAPDLVLTMTTQAELDRVDAGAFGADLAAAGIAWRHLPIIDFGTPDASILVQWREVSKQSAVVLAHGGSILIHCFGGCGRSGMVVLRFMVEAGEDPAKALARLRQTRPCAVETDAQKEWGFSGV